MSSERPGTQNVQLTHAEYATRNLKFPVCVVAPDIDVPMNIGSLFRIADQVKGTVVGFGVGVDLPERGVLHRVGVLELIHQRHRVRASQGPRQHRPLIGAECVAQGAQQVNKR